LAAHTHSYSLTELYT